MSQKWCSFLASPVRWHTSSAHCIINEVYFGHVIKVVSAMLLHWNVTLVSFVIWMYSVGRFKSMYYKYLLPPYFQFIYLDSIFLLSLMDNNLLLSLCILILKFSQSWLIGALSFFIQMAMAFYIFLPASLSFWHSPLFTDHFLSFYHKIFYVHFVFSLPHPEIGHFAKVPFNEEL